MPLRKDVLTIGQRIVDHFDNPGDPPFLLYQYRPQEEYPVRRDLAELRKWLVPNPEGSTAFRSRWPISSGKPSPIRAGWSD